MKIDLHTARVLLFLLAISVPAVAAAISTNPADYAIVGENGVSMNSYCTCLGDIYSRGDLNLQFGYGIQSGSNAGNMISTGNVNVGLESNVTGNIYANGGVSLNGDDTITGNVVYGTTYGTSLTGNLVTGTVTQAANSVPAVNLPTATGFTPGTTDINASSNLTLAPGSYGNVTESGLYQNVYLSSGDYYLKSFNMPSGGYLYLNITNAPIRVFVQGNVDFGSYLTTYLNGQSSGTSSLASCVLFQAGGNFNLDGGSLYNFYGTVFTPSGSVSLSNDSMYGSIMSSGSVGAETYLTKTAYNWSNLPMLSMATTGATIIAGGTANVGVSLTNIGISGGSAANYSLGATVSSGSVAGLASLSQSGTLAAQSSRAFSSSLTSTTLGLNTVTIAATAASALSPVQSAAATLTVLDHSNASLSATANRTTQTINFGNVLRGAAVPSQSFTIYNRAANTSAAYTANLKLTTGFTTTGDGALTTNLSTFNGLTAGNGNTYAASLNTSNYTTTGTSIITASASQLADDSSLSGSGNNNNGAIGIVLQGNVGNATADKSNSQSSFGPALTAPVVPNASYANLESKATATTGSGGYGMIGSTATILAGTNGSSSSQTVSMSWRTQTQAERTGPELVSDIVQLSGMAYSGSQTSPFVLQMTYNPLLSGGAGYLAWLDPSDNKWENAIGGNIGTNLGSFHLGAWPTGDMTLGEYGVNTANDTVWAILNHNGDFAVIPSPVNGTWAVNGNGTWSGTANWTGGIPASGQDTAVFGTVLTSGTATITLDSSRSLSSLGLSTTGANSYTISSANSSTLTLANTGGAASIGNSGGKNTVAAPIILGSNLSVTASTGSTLTIAGGISESNRGTSLSFGGGELIFSGTDTYTGGTVVSGGTLAVTSANALPTSGVLVVGRSGRVVLGNAIGAAEIVAKSPLTSESVSLAAVPTVSSVDSSMAVPASSQAAQVSVSVAAPMSGETAAVPEPGTIALLAAGVMVLAVARRRGGPGISWITDLRS